MSESTSDSSRASRRRPKNKGDSVERSVSRSRSPSSSRRRPKNKGDSVNRSVSRSRSNSTRQRLARSKSGTESNRGSSRTVSVKSGLSGPSDRNERPRRKGTGSGKRHVEERFFGDLKKAADKKNEAQNKKKRALNDLRSNGAKQKCSGLVEYSKKSGYKVSATFLPTWAKGKPHVVLSKNWRPDDRPLRPSRDKEYVKGYEDVRPFSEVESEADADDEDEGTVRKRNLVKSPNLAKPLAASAEKGKKKKVIRCTICNSSYRENTNVLWMFCGGSGGKRCNKLAIHAACHFVVGNDQDEIDKMCKKFIRCYDCRQIEHFKKRPNQKGQKKKSSSKNMGRGPSNTSMAEKKRGQKKKASNENVGPGPSNTSMAEKERGQKKKASNRNVGRGQSTSSLDDFVVD